MGHVALGLVRLFYDWDLAAARSCLEHAIELNPGSAEARHWAGYCYMASGHFDEFLETAQVAASLDPLSLPALDTLVLLTSMQVASGTAWSTTIAHSKSTPPSAPPSRACLGLRPPGRTRPGHRRIPALPGADARRRGGPGHRSVPLRAAGRTRRPWATSPSSRSWSGPARNSPSISTSRSPSPPSIVSTRRSSGWNEPSRPASAPWSSSDTASPGITSASILAWTRSWPPWGCSKTGFPSHS